MATSTMQATNGGVISWIPPTVSSPSLGRRPGPAGGARPLRDPAADAVEAGEPELLREVVPFLVVARHFLAAERRALLEPAAQPRRERGALVFVPLQELEQLALAVEVGERRAAQDLNELVAVQRAVDPILEVLLACREVVGALGCDPLQPGEDVARDLDRGDGRGPDVRGAAH